MTRDERLQSLYNEMIEWAEGRRSNLNEFYNLENDPSDRQQTLVRVAQADAAEVQKLSAAIIAIRAME